MPSILEQPTRNALIQRINQLNTNSHAEWGKMNAYQVATHCALWEEMILQNKKYKRPFIGKLIGPIILRTMLNGDKPLSKNNPTIPDLLIKETKGSIENEKAKWISLLNQYSEYNVPDYTYVHPFFGKMSRSQIGILSYKHNDHHLRQFGV